MGKVGTEATLQEILGEVKAVRGFTDIIANGMTTRDWRALKKLIDDDLAPSQYPVGSQFYDTWNQNDQTELTVPWDVVHYNTAGDMFLKWHYAYPDGVPFDEPEAIYYAGAGGLAAGTYNIPIGSAYGEGWQVGKAIQFTLNNAMAEGDQLVINCGTNYANDPTNGRTWNVYAAGSTTSKDTGTTSNGTNGTSLGTIGNVNAHRTNGQLNAISRVVYGSGRWKESAVRQYLNSTAAAGLWWTMQNGWDRPPAAAATLRGFLAGCSAEFLSILEPVEVVTALNTQEGFTETTETTMDRIFLPSLQEMYVNPQLADVEGEDWDYFKTLAEEAGLSGKFAQGGTYPVLITYNAAATTSPGGVWLRSCIRGNANLAWFVGTSGGVSNGTAYNAPRGCPACKIKKSA